jgi:hypothetical protein
LAWLASLEKKIPPDLYRYSKGVDTHLPEAMPHNAMANTKEAKNPSEVLLLLLLFQVDTHPDHRKAYLYDIFQASVTQKLSFSLGSS